MTMQGSRTFREGSVGLLILVGLGLLGALILWLRGFSPNQRSYRAIVEFADARGIQAGTQVRFRGVPVGRVRAIRPGPNGVDVELEITPADLIIPRNVTVTPKQSGLIGETLVGITPLTLLPEGAVTALPLDPDCDPTLIICHQARIQGQAGVSVDELLRATLRFTNLFSDPEFFATVQSATRNASDAAAGITQLTREVTGLTQALRQELGTLTVTAQVTAGSVGRAADQLGLTAAQVNDLIVTNRTTLVGTLNNLSQSSDQLRVFTQQLTPVATRLEQGEFLRNLETLSANAAQASATLRDVSTAFNTPTNLLVLQQTLDSARVTFQNAQKITSDLDELTGDPAFRNNIRNLINGLGGLVSSTQQLEQQAQLAQILEPLAATLEAPEPGSPATTLGKPKPATPQTLTPLAEKGVPQARLWQPAPGEPTLRPLTAQDLPLQQFPRSRSED